MKAELRMYFWTVVKHSFSERRRPPERDHQHDVTHPGSQTFSIFPLWMDSDLPEELLGAVKKKKKGWLIRGCTFRLIDQPVAPPLRGYLCRTEKMAG